MDCKTLWKTYFSLFLLFLILRHWRTKLLAKHRENPIFPWSMDTKLLTPIITPHWSSPSPPFSMLIYARPKCGIGLKIGGINIEWGGKGDILRQYFLFWGENGTFANLFCPPVSEMHVPCSCTLVRYCHPLFPTKMVKGTSTNHYRVFFHQEASKEMALLPFSASIHSFTHSLISSPIPFIQAIVQ